MCYTDPQHSVSFSCLHHVYVGQIFFFTYPQLIFRSPVLLLCECRIQCPSSGDRRPASGIFCAEHNSHSTLRLSALLAYLLCICRLCPKSYCGATCNTIWHAVSKAVLIIQSFSLKPSVGGSLYYANTFLDVGPS